MMNIYLQNKAYAFPTNWNELSKKQFLRVMKAFTFEYSPISLYPMLFKLLAGISWWRYYRLPVPEIEERLHLLDFLFKQSNCTKNHLDKYRSYYGPADNFTNMRMAEFVFCEDYYRQYKASHDGKYLDLLIGVLYRPRKENYDVKTNADGDPRIEFNENFCRYFATRVKRWPVHVKEGILLWYEACLAQLVADYPDVFKGEDGKVSKYGMVDIIRNVAAGGVFGDFSAVEKQYLRLVLMELDNMKSEAEEINKTS